MLTRLPGVSLVRRRVNGIREGTNRRIQKAKDNVFRGGMVILAFGTLIWVSIFIYLAFYYAYIPIISHSKPIHLNFKTCDEPESRMCSFPSAYIELTKRQQLLMIGQKYGVTVELEMPESDANLRQGMFLVCVKLQASSSVVAEDCRATMLRYRSTVLKYLRTALMAPIFIFGSSEEKQNIRVDVFTDYYDNRDAPITAASVELRSRQLQVYSARLLVTADFSGLRHLMYHWPIISGLVGTGFIMSTLLLIIGLSWHRIAQGDNLAARASRSIRDHLAAFVLEGEDEEEIEAVDAIDDSNCSNKSCDNFEDSDDESIERLPDMN